MTPLFSEGRYDVFRADPSKDRHTLGFKNAVLSNFAFLDDYGLKLVEEDTTFVRYESDTVFVNVYHGRGSYEIGVEIGRLDRAEKYGLDHIVSGAGESVWEAEGLGRGTMFQTSTHAGVLKIVPKVAYLVRQYGGPFLSGRPAFYQELQEANEREARAFERAQNFTRIRREAETAWRGKDYLRMSELLRPVRDDLTTLESKRLDYAEKQIGS